MYIRVMRVMAKENTRFVRSRGLQIKLITLKVITRMIQNNSL